MSNQHQSNAVCVESLDHVLLELQVSRFFSAFITPPNLYTVWGQKVWEQPNPEGSNLWTKYLWAVQLRITAELVLKDRTGLERPAVAEEEKTSRQGQRQHPHLGFFSVQADEWADGRGEPASERGEVKTSGGGGSGSVSVCAECHLSPDISSGWRLFHTRYWRRR